MEKISLKADYAFKELFAHEKVRKQFLSDVLGIPLEQIRSVRMANPFSAEAVPQTKAGILDVLLVLMMIPGLALRCRYTPRNIGRKGTCTIWGGCIQMN